jgi:hypothetical protein
LLVLSDLGIMWVGLVFFTFLGCVAHWSCIYGFIALLKFENIWTFYLKCFLVPLLSSVFQRLQFHAYLVPDIVPQFSDALLIFKCFFKSLGFIMSLNLLIFSEISNLAKHS